MTIILIILELIVVLLVISMIYSVAQMNQANKEKFTRLAQKQLSLENKISALEKQIARLKNDDE